MKLDMIKNPILFRALMFLLVHEELIKLIKTAANNNGIAKSVAGPL